MDEYQTEEETVFVVEEVSRIINEAVEAAIGRNAYQHSRVNQWTTSIVEQCLSQLSKLGKPFKYIGIHHLYHHAEEWSRSANSQHVFLGQLYRRLWCEKRTTFILFLNNFEGEEVKSVLNAGSCTVRWENKFMYCIVSVFGLAI